MGWVVNFHADGGQMCVPGTRDFGEDREKAEAFVEMMRNEKGHTCEDIAQENDRSTVKLFYSTTPVDDTGAVYPSIAGSTPEGSRWGEDETKWLKEIHRFTDINV